MTTEAVRLTDDQFRALERWIRSIATQAAMPLGFANPHQTQSIRDTAYVALTGRRALEEQGS